MGRALSQSDEHFALSMSVVISKAPLYHGNPWFATWEFTSILN